MQFHYVFKGLNTLSRVVTLTSDKIVFVFPFWKNLLPWENFSSFSKRECCVGKQTGSQSCLPCKKKKKKGWFKKKKKKGWFGM